MLNAVVKGPTGECLLRFSLPLNSPLSLFEDVALEVWPKARGPSMRVVCLEGGLGAILRDCADLLAAEGRVSYDPIALRLVEDKVVAGGEAFVPLVCEDCGSRANLEFATEDQDEPLSSLLCAKCAGGHKHWLLARNCMGWGLASSDCREYWAPRAARNAGRGRPCGCARAGPRAAAPTTPAGGARERRLRGLPRAPHPEPARRTGRGGGGLRGGGPGRRRPFFAANIPAPWPPGAPVAAMIDWSNLDYTSMWDGIYAPPDSGALGSLYVLESERTVGRNTPIYDDCTRLLFDEAHPRTYPAGQRYPGPYGAGRATDRIGPDLADRRQTDIEHERAALAAFRNSYYDALDASPIGGAPPSPSALRSMRWFGGGGESRPETFAGRPEGPGDPSADNRRRYAEGNRFLGRPGPRGMVTSFREGRPGLDGVDFDNRPYHYNPSAPNEYAHLFINPADRGPPLFSEAPSSYLGPNPQIPQVDHFVPLAGLGAALGKTGASAATGAASAGSPGAPGSAPPWAADPLYLYKLAFVFIIVILLATWVMVSQAEQRLGAKIDALAPAAPAARPAAA